VDSISGASCVGNAGKKITFILVSFAITGFHYIQFSENPI